MMVTLEIKIFKKYILRLICNIVNAFTDNESQPGHWLFKVTWLFTNLLTSEIQKYHIVLEIKQKENEINNCS